MLLGLTSLLETKMTELHEEAADKPHLYPKQEFGKAIEDLSTNLAGCIYCTRYCGILNKNKWSQLGQGVEEFDCQADDLNSAPESTGWKNRTDSLPASCPLVSTYTHSCKN